MPSAYLLVSHGSRDPQVAMNQLAALISQRQCEGRINLHRSLRDELVHPQLPPQLPRLRQELKQLPVQKAVISSSTTAQLAALRGSH